MIGLLEPINSRITDPRYFLTTPHEGKLRFPPSEAGIVLLEFTPLLEKSLWRRLNVKADGANVVDNEYLYFFSCCHFGESGTL